MLMEKTSLNNIVAESLRQRMLQDPESDNKTGK